jgi:hypothetical protein
MFLNCFDVLISKMIFKKMKKKHYFDVFLSESTLKNNHYYTSKHPLNVQFWVYGVSHLKKQTELCLAGIGNCR